MPRSEGADLFAETAARLLAERKRKQAKEQRKVLPPLMDYVPRLDPKLERPEHLAPIVNAFERIKRGETVRECFSVPPRHWKSTTVQGGCVWLMDDDDLAGFNVGYFTYGHSFSQRQSRKTHRLAENAGCKFRRDTYEEWELVNGSLFRCTSLKAGATGEGFDLIVVDDPYSGRADAESSAYNATIIEAFDEDVYTRQENKPTSFIIIHTRWTVNDLIAHVTAPDYMGGRPFAYTNLPAINDDGESLLPKYWPVERLEEQKSQPYKWASQFMGRPVPRGSEVFKTPATCSLGDVPSFGQYAIGIDLAYTKKTKSDYSIMLTMVKDHQGRMFVADVQRKRERSSEFRTTLRAGAQRHPGAPMRWYCAGTEIGVADLVEDDVVKIQAKPATQDKFVRAQPVSEAWNAGQVIVPADAPWYDDFIREVTQFTGVADSHDDQVDALAAAFDALAEYQPPLVESWGRRRTASLRSSY